MAADCFKKNAIRSYQFRSRFALFEVSRFEERATQREESQGALLSSKGQK
jgi:hypothetical protein